MTSAPLLGAYIQVYFGWHANFIFLLGYASLGLIVTLVLLHETSQHHHRDNLKIKRLISNYRTVMTNKTFLVYASSITFTFTAIFAWITIGPILLIQKMQLSPTDFGWIVLGIGIIYASGSLSNAYFVEKYGISRMVSFGSLVMVLGAVATIVSAPLHYWFPMVISVYIFIWTFDKPDMYLNF